jgi:hypothetical protein
MVQAATVERAAARELQVRIAETEADRRRVYAFRWRVQVEELKLDPPGADRKAKLVRDGLDDAAVQLFVTQGGETQAALRLLPGAAAILPQAKRSSM